MEESRSGVSEAHPVAGAHGDAVVASYATDSLREGRVILRFPGTVFRRNWSACGCGAEKPTVRGRAIEKENWFYCKTEFARKAGECDFRFPWAILS